MSNCHIKSELVHIMNGVDSEIIRLLIAIAATWHVMGFAFGFVYIFFSLKSLFNVVPYDQRWSRVIRASSLHLWLSGIVLIVLGVIQAGDGYYLSNPKLWCKATVILVWFTSTQLMRNVAIPLLIQGNSMPMLQLSAVSLSCWIYGAFIGCAKPLAYGAVSYTQFMTGFIFLILASFFAIYCVKKYKPPLE